MNFEVEKLRFLKRLPSRSGAKTALEYEYDSRRFLVYPQALPFGEPGREDVTIHYRLDDAALTALMDDEEWLGGALAFFEKDYFARCAQDAD